MSWEWANQMNYWQNDPKFFVSLLKAWYGKASTKDNDFCFELMHQGRMNGYVCQGFNPIGSIPDKQKVTEALSKLKFLVVIDPLATDTSTFWKPTTRCAI